MLLRHVHARSETIFATVDVEVRAALEEEHTWKEFHEEMRVGLPHKMQEIQQNIQRKIAQELDLAPKRSPGAAGFQTSSHRASLRRVSSIREQAGGSLFANLVVQAFQFGKGHKEEDTPQLPLLDQLLAAKKLYTQTAFAMQVEIEELDSQIVLTKQTRSEDLDHQHHHHNNNANNNTDNMSDQSDPLSFHSNNGNRNRGAATPTTTPAASPAEVQLTVNASDALDHLFESELVLLRKVLLSLRLRRAVRNAREETLMFS